MTAIRKIMFWSLAMVLSLLLVTCTKNPPSPEAVEWMKKYHEPIKGDASGGWVISEIKADGSNISIRVAIPTQQAVAYMHDDSERLFHVMGAILCPSDIEPIWKMLKEDNDIVYHVAAIGREPFLDLGCRQTKRLGLRS